MTDLLRPDKFTIPRNSLPAGLYSLVTNDDPFSGLLPPLRIMFDDNDAPALQLMQDQFIRLPRSARYVQTGDVAWVNQNSVRVVLSKSANSNTLLVTERCDNRCLFCSQPPIDQNDDILLATAAQALVAFNAESLVGVSGGEPLLYRHKFIKFLETLDLHSVPTPLHILSNGRAFAEKGYARNLRSSTNRSIAFGIPIYATYSALHDELVGKQGAWIETVHGLLNASAAGIPIELRFIPTKRNVDELTKLVPFVARSFQRVNQISVMNIEPQGWAKKNWNELYESPLNYAGQLIELSQQARFFGSNLALYNFPLCHLPDSVHHLAVQSISDWKNYYPQECSDCPLRPQCGGYFSSAQGAYLDMPRKLTS